MRARALSWRTVVERGPFSARSAWRLLSGLAVVICAGCTTPSQYVHNGFKVGPNYTPALAAVSQHWIDGNDIQSTPNPEV